MDTKQFDFQTFQSILQKSFHTSTPKENIHDIQQHTKMSIYSTELVKSEKYATLQTTATTFWPDINQADIAKKYYQQSGDRRALDEAVVPWEHILAHPGFATTHTDFRLTMLNESATSYFRRYWAIGNPEDLERALVCWLEAVKQAPQNFPSLPSYLNNLGNGLLERYAHHGYFDDLIHAIKAFEQAVQQTSIDSSVLPGYLSNLGNGFYARYSHTDNFSDLAQAINAFERAVQHTPIDSPALPDYLNSLGNVLHERYTQRGNLDDLTQAINCYEHAIEYSPIDCPNLVHYFSHLGSGLYDRYVYTTDLEDLQDAVKAFEQAVQQTPKDSPNLPLYLSKLAQGLHDRYVRYTEKEAQDVNDLKNAIEAYEKAIQLLPKNSPDLPKYLKQLEEVRRERQIDDISHLIETHRQAFQNVSVDSPLFPTYLRKLGDGLRDRYVHTKNPSDLQEAIENYQQSAQKGLEVAVKESLISATSWLSWAFHRQTWQEVEQAYHYAYLASEQVLNLQLLSRHDKEILLRDIQELATQAAYALAKNNQLPAAILAIERGLVRLFNEFLVIDKTHLEQLKVIGYKDLYERYRQAVANWQQVQQSESVHTHLQITHQELDDAIAAIRQVEGYANFLVTPELEDILAVVKDTTLVYLVITQIGGVALIVYDGGKITPVWLPELKETTLQQRILNNSEDNATDSYLPAYFAWRETNGVDMSIKERWFNVLAETTHWLWEIVMEPIIKALPSTTKITLIPFGKLGLLPLHAAWTEDDTALTGKRYALDTLTISYAPHARALATARKIADQIVPDTLLAIDDPLSLKTNPLPDSDCEIKTLFSTFDEQHRYLLRQTHATHTAVIDALQKCNVLYFSCCGYTNLRKPLESRLAMAHDEFITLKELLELHLNGVRLATLSTCEIDKLRMALPDEIVSFSAGLLQAGVAGVVGSLWIVTDLSNKIFMNYFYDQWRTGNLEPVEALRQAQLWMRDATNAEKLAYFQKHGVSEENVMHVMNATTHNAVQTMENHSNERVFEHPFYWAAFGYMGV